MPGDETFTTFVALIDTVGHDVQNVQELARIWGEIREELDARGMELEQSYAVLGEIDFLVVYQAPDLETAFKTSLVLERHGLDVQTMEMTPTDDFASMVEDI